MIRDSKLQPFFNELNISFASSYSKKDQKVPEASEEEGEISEAADKIQYDFDRLPEWPGFNVDLPENFKDESRKYNAPMMRDDQVTHNWTFLAPQAPFPYFASTDGAARIFLVNSLFASPKHSRKTQIHGPTGIVKVRRVGKEKGRRKKPENYHFAMTEI